MAARRAGRTCAHPARAPGSPAGRRPQAPRGPPGPRTRATWRSPTSAAARRPPRRRAARSRTSAARGTTPPTSPRWTVPARRPRGTAGRPAWRPRPARTPGRRTGPPPSCATGPRPPRRASRPRGYAGPGSGRRIAPKARATWRRACGRPPAACTSLLGSPWGRRPRCAMPLGTHPTRSGNRTRGGAPAGARTPRRNRTPMPASRRRRRPVPSSFANLATKPKRSAGRPWTRNRPSSNRPRHIPARQCRQAPGRPPRRPPGAARRPPPRRPGRRRRRAGNRPRAGPGARRRRAKSPAPRRRLRLPPPVCTAAA
mmetsp:Transcript_35041/g.105859  ORF Transcript_35041/g.105859 Transcript_35041/m.105859 type:complete len:313 (-) Transcript_35041:531-1469(-)